MSKKILITGANGQLGHEMRNILEGDSRFECIFTDVAELDICDADAVNRAVAENRVDYIVNCAAYTQVDKAEDNVELCRKINAGAVENLARAAASCGARMIHVSTDYVFNGRGYRPYTEDMTPEPQSVYGSTKLEGEQALQSLCPQSVIIRTAWLYSPYGNNFVKTMMRLGTERDELSVVADQIGTPTCAADLARAILAVLTAETFVPGIYHFSDEGACSWYDFTVAIHRLARISCRVNPIRSDEYPSRAHRPFYSVLDKSKIKQTYGITIPHWYESLSHCIEILQETH
ncbi:dTDP-4-dehydrorhamnose reductase [Barnesiella sp. An55]|uniref:dTDP-4-dehydrorhamnose reductase n=1 Tax=Barnesiella sp. An55 TaxID=1965646 RepID=UPI000B38B23F|nr:dTDP-4-dehydrorhamnose reductase [Barnesiella sp. An55]OUN73687.1 dTDP-4-dehydrorhamnose reductase [Barnesiella sp. An55]